jgi:hypothetical protein
MSRKLWIGLVLLGWSASTAGCSSSSDNTSSTTEPTTALASCEQFCVLEDSCDATTTIDDCKMYRCGTISAQTATCQASLKTYYDCMRKQSDKCAAGCTTEEAAFHTACS